MDGCGRVGAPSAGALVALALPASLALAGCSSSPTSSGTTTSGPSGGSSTSTTVSPGPWTSCKEVPLDTINSTLGLDVVDPQETVVNTTSTCGYTEGGTASPLIVQIVEDATPEEFAHAVQGFKSHDQNPVVVHGLGDEAVSVALSASGAATTTVMARLGSTQVLVAAPASQQQVSELVTAILAKS